MENEKISQLSPFRVHNNNKEPCEPTSNGPVDQELPVECSISYCPTAEWHSELRAALEVLLYNIVVH